MSNSVPALILSHEELCMLTGRRRFSAQTRALARMGISHLLRPDGFPIVSRAQFEAIIGAESTSRPSTVSEPDWSALDAA
jgi:hypothetical protein